MLDRQDREKLYIRLTGIFMDKVHSGEWRVGAQVPTEEDLCRSMGVSKITVRRAVENLVMQGYLEKLQGKGTFVRQGPPRSGMPMKTTLVESVFLPGDALNVKVQDRRIVSLPEEEILVRMGPVADRDFFFLKRLKTKEGVPVLVNEVYIPLRACPAIRDWDAGEGSVFDFLRKNSPHRISRVSQAVLVGRPGEHAAALNIRTGAPCMLIHRVFYASDTTLAYSRTVARGDRFSLDSEFERLA